MLENGQVKVHPAVYEFYKSFSETGLLGFALFYTLFGVISGHLADKYSRRNIIPARIVDAGQEVGLIMESLMAAIAHKQRLRDFLEGRAKKVGE